MPSPYTVINAATVAAGSSSATPVSQAITKQLCSIDVTVTNGSTAQDNNSVIRVFYAATPLTITDTNVKAQLPSVGFVDVKIDSMAASAVKNFKSGPFIADGSTVWLWTQGERLAGSVTLTATLFEIA